MRKVSALLALCALALAACSVTAAGPAPTVTVTVTAPPPAYTAPPAPPQDPSDAPLPDGRGPLNKPLVVPDGTWLVGTDIPSGQLSQPGEAYGCTWSVTDETGQLVETVTETAPTPGAVRLRTGDTFTSAGCFAWAWHEASGATGDSSMFKDIGKPVTPGTYTVGQSVKAGLYHLVKPQSGPCRYSVKLRLNDGSYEPLNDFDSTSFGARSSADGAVTLENGDLFETDGCGVWVRFGLA